MKIIIVAALVGLSLFARPQPGFAEESNVQELLGHCTSPENSFSYGFCVGLIGGVSEQLELNALVIQQHPSTDPAMKIFSSCPDQNARPTYGARVQAFINWARANRQQWTQPDIKGVVAAMISNWPCPGNPFKP